MTDGTHLTHPALRADIFKLVPEWQSTDLRPVLHCWVIFSLNQIKGGTMKSSFSVHLAGFVAEQGSSVLLLDCDPLQASSIWARNACPQVKTLTQDDPDKLFDLVPSLVKRHDHIVIDGPGSASEMTRAILCLADIAVIPVGPSNSDLRAADETSILAMKASGLRGDGKPTVAWLPCLYANNSNQASIAFDQISHPGRTVLPGVARRTAIPNAERQDQLVWHGKDSVAAAEIQLSIQALLEL